MSRDPVQFGIQGFGYAFGDDQDVVQVAGDYVDDPERIIQWGYHTFHRAAKDVTAVELAADAGRKALVQVDLAAESVDLIVLATSEMPEYPHWDSSAALARELGLPRAQTLLLNEGCASGVTGLGMVAGLMAVQAEIETVLFVAVNRVSEFHRNRMRVNNAIHSDGAVAAVLRRGHPHTRWLATEQFTDPELCDWFRTDYGGAVAPVPPPGWTSATAPAGHERVQTHFDKDPKRLREFVDVLNARVVEVIEGACRRAGIDRDEVAHVIYINDSPEAIDDIAAPFGLPRERTNASLAVMHGHMGAADQLTSLGQHLERGELADGDVVALAGISIGMRWYCTLVRI
ncbi:3-oxoacyl-[acyl-carrier-protein] synthase III C-terminal domain-containing protein [Micromonospora zamorensis]|uniref:3-oxoacyl-[acyl-carrier-protein] synthase III C-terminal domain-containing protein n=1 Tax=Micromonospora zamorensis TaxID=709883 RepID=UPI003D961D39